MYRQSRLRGVTLLSLVALSVGLVACHIDASGLRVRQAVAIWNTTNATLAPCCADQAHYVTPTPAPTLSNIGLPPVPWPEIKDVGEPLLDEIHLVNARLVNLPKQADTNGPVAVTQWSWSPTSEQLILMAEWNEPQWVGNTGQSSANTWLVDFKSGQAIFWQANALWPTWSRDGQSIFYQVLVADTIGFYTDLYERRLDEPTGRLLVRAVGRTDSYQPSALDAADGALLFNDINGQPVLLPAGLRFGLNPNSADQVYPLVLADLVHKAPPRDEQGKFIPTRFLLAPDGQKVAMLPFRGAFYIIDLVHFTILVEFADEHHQVGSAVWSSDSQSLAIANHDGVFVYNLVHHETHTLITRQDLHFPVESFWDSFGVFTWSPDRKVVIFQAIATDWRPLAKQGREARVGNFTFGALADGSQRRPLLAEAIASISPDKCQALIQHWDEVTQQYVTYLVAVEWGMSDTCKQQH